MNSLSIKPTERAQRIVIIGFKVGASVAFCTTVHNSAQQSPAVISTQLAEAHCGNSGDVPESTVSEGLLPTQSGLSEEVLGENEKGHR